METSKIERLRDMKKKEEKQQETAKKKMSRKIVVLILWNEYDGLYKIIDKKQLYQQ